MSEQIQGYRLSPQQERLWPWARRDPERYWTQAVAALPGPLDAARLREALAGVAERHEILRTSLRTLPGLADAVQVIGPAAPPEVRVVTGDDIDGLLLQERGDRAPDAAPLLRCAVTDARDGGWRLLLSAPALCLDAASMRTVARDVLALYQGRRQDSSDMPVQYADYAEWQRQLAEEATPGPGITETIPLQESCLRLGPGGLGEVAAAAEAVGVPLGTLLLACWGVALRAASLESVAGAPLIAAVDGRAHPRLETALGLYEQWAALPGEIGGGVTLARLARGVEDQVAAAVPTAHGSPEAVSFAFRSAADEPAIVSLRSRTAPAGLELAVTRTAGGWEIRLAFDPRRHPARETGLLAERFVQVARTAAAGPSIAVAAVDAATDAERRLFAAYNDTAAEEPAASVLARFDAQAARTPEATAAVWPGGRLTYAGLAERVARIAAALTGAGVRRGDRVALRLGRSPDQVACVLACWRAGAAFVAIGAADPPARAEAVVRAAGCRLVVTDARDRTLAGAAVLCLDELPPQADTEPARDVPGLGDLACVAHTSGSTGTPNGVLLHHRGVANYLRYVIDEYGITGDDVVLQQAPFTFDAWLRDCVAPLLAGASIVILTEEQRLDSMATAEAVERHQVTRILHSVPTTLRGLADAALSSGRRLHSVTTVLSSGEPLFRTDCDRLRAVFGPGVTIVNQYGPTECTMTTTFHRVTGGEPHAIPIGRPIRNARLYVLDADGRPAPTGVTGEVCIGGIGVTYGYLDRPELTGERFVPDPFAERPGARMYRTGDLARRLPDGSISLLGRIDHQIKLHGVRIDPGEIESCLAAHDAVREAAVVAVPGPSGGLVLSAHLVPHEPGALDDGDLAAWAAERLPAHLVPARFTVTGALPRTRHGKVDRRALTDQDSRRETGACLPPRTEAEAVIARVFAETLGLDRVGADGHFFRLGGHSLLATKVVYEIGEALGVRLELRSIFDHPTVAGLARVAESAERGTAPIARQPDRPAHPVSFAQRRLWLADTVQAQGSAGGSNVQIVARAEGRLDAGTLSRALSLLVERHEVLRTVFSLAGGEPVQSVRQSSPVVVEVTDLAGAGDRDEQVRRIIREDARTRFDLSALPLFRTRLIRTGPEEAVLLLTLHHIVIDEWSVGVLLRELVEVYRALSQDRRPELPEPQVRYLDFAAWQRSWLSGERMEELSAYWRRRLDGAPLEVALPADKPRPKVPTLSGGRISMALPAGLTTALARLAEERGATLFMVLLAAFKALLHHSTGQEDLVVGSPIAGRTRREVENVVGFFANVLVLRTSLAGDPRFGELVGRVKETALGAYGHQDMPFDTLVEMLGPGRAAHRIPLARVWFVLHNTPMPELEAPGLKLTLQERPSDLTTFDLNLALTETESGLVAALAYSDDLFSPSTAERLLHEYRRLLEAVVDDPEIRLSDLRRHVTRSGRKERLMTYKRQAESGARSFATLKTRKVRPVRVTGDSLVSTEPMGPGPSQPLVITPSGGGLAPAEWVAGNRELLAGHLRTRGAVLLRGFDVTDAAGFEQVVQAYSPRTLDYYERSTPRQEVSGKVYTSTEFPPERHIPLHSESAYSYYWPMTLWFCCITPADEGGATPIADTRELLRLLGPGLRERLAERKVMYIRNYHDGFDIPWQVAFQTEDPEVVAAYCRRTGMEWEWLPGGRLRTRQVLDAIVTHPDTGDRVFFNQVHAYHIASLDPETRAAVSEMFAPDDLPRDVRYGDGTPFTAAELEEIRRAYEQATVAFPWRRGDVMALDNMLMAHGREPYRGFRKVVVAMSDPYDRRKLREKLGEVTA